jgi:beta-glucosidase
MTTSTPKRLIRVVVVVLMVCTTLGCQPASKTSSLTSDSKVQALLSQMTLAEKVGQMTQVNRVLLEKNKREGDVTKLGFGSLLNGGLPKVDTVSGPADWANMYDAFQRRALASRLKIPMIYGIDAVHGMSSIYGGVVFPHNIGLGAMRDTGLVRQMAEVTAAEVAATGIDWTFAPCISVVRDERWGRTYEGFGETSELAASNGLAYTQGVQNNARARIAASIKHFGGDGGTTGGVDQGDTRIDTATLRRIHLDVYLPSIRAGAMTVMASYNSWRGNKVHGIRYLLTTLLKEEYGFKGFVISDWQAVDQLSGSYEENIVQCINAGVDMVMVPDSFPRFMAGLTKAVREGRIPMQRIDDAVARILKVKFDLGLFEKPFADRSLLPAFGSEQHRKVARACVQKSLVVLKNESQTLPLSKRARIHVVGRGANDIGLQCGGWTMTWQGAQGAITKGTTLLQGLREVAPSAVITYDTLGNVPANAEVTIVVLSEPPYAEFMGDRRSLTINPQQLAVVDRAAKSGKPVVLISMIGRPIVLGAAAEQSKSIVAAWLPGSEGAGVADVLFGDVQPTGKLPHSWPARMDQIPVNIGDKEYNPLYPYGFGLSFR